MIRTILDLIDAVCQGLLFGFLCGWVLLRAVRPVGDWLNPRHPIDPLDTNELGSPLTYFGGPRDGERVLVRLLGGEHWPGGLYRLDAQRNAYVWREQRLPAVDWSDLERDN